jgi:hypothetical protein
MSRLALVALALSFVVTAGYVVATPRAHTHDNPFTDHHSHYGSAILFAYRGWDVYRMPIDDACPVRGTERQRQYAARHRINPRDVCDIPERDSARPLVINWSQFPRPYPPGALLYAAPEALLYEHTSLPLETINLLSILKHVLAACLFTAALASVLLWRRRWASASRWDRIAIAGAWGIVAVVHVEAMRWARVGFYDAVYLLFVCLALRDAQRHRWLPCILMWTVAAFLHFRALWYLPLPVYAAFRYLRAAGFRRHDAVHIAVIGALGAATVASLATVRPFLSRFPLTNRMHVTELFGAAPGVIAAVVAVSAAGIVWRWSRLAATCIVWAGVVIVQTYQMQAWHVLSLFPLLGVAAASAHAPRAWRHALLFTGVACLAFSFGGYGRWPAVFP